MPPNEKNDNALGRLLAEVTWQVSCGEPDGVIIRKLKKIMSEGEAKLILKLAKIEHRKSFKTIREFNRLWAREMIFPCLLILSGAYLVFTLTSGEGPASRVAQMHWLFILGGGGLAYALFRWIFPSKYR